MKEIDLLREFGNHIDAQQAAAHHPTEDRVFGELIVAAERTGTSEPRRRAWLAPGLAVMITAAVIGTAAVLGLVALRGSASDQGRPSAADQGRSTGVGRPAESNDRAGGSQVDAPAAGDAGVLVTAAGWKMTRVAVSDSDWSPRVSGEATFTDGSASVNISWDPPHPDAPPVDLTQGSGDPLIVDGVNGEGRLDEHDPYAATVVGDGYHYRIVGDGLASKDAFRTVVESMMWVDEKSWVAALPESAVQPKDRAAVVEEILADIPVPESVDVEALKEGDEVEDRYDATADVTGAVACGWFDQYVEAAETGDTAATDEAREALATAREWDALVEIESEGGWSGALWEYTDALVNGGTVGSGSGGVGPTDVVEGDALDSGKRSYENALGCP